MNKLSLYQEVYYLMMIKMLSMVLHKNNIKGKDIFNALSEYEVKRRGDMEEDPTFKQLISYCLLENEKEKFLSTNVYLVAEKRDYTVNLLLV